jgi:glycerophosphoryl diester phosphodiesterase
MRRFLFLFTGFCCAGLAVSAAVEEVTPSERLARLMALDRPLVIAHRGFSMAAPENTLPAFKLGLLAQSDLVELDYSHSRDGVPVVLHDWTLDRTTNARDIFGGENIAVSAKTVEELRKLDAGTWFSPLYAGVGLPTLAESLDLIQPESITLVERKQGDPETVVRLLRDKDMLNDVIVQAFDWDYLAGCHELAPGLVLGALGPPRRPDGSRYEVNERFLNEAFLDRVQASGAKVVGWNRQVTPEAVAEAQRRGLKVWIYTINDLEETLRFMRMGVDGIISDNPAMVWKALALLGREEG